MKIIEESIQIAYQLFPQSYEAKTKGQVFHWAMLYKRSKLLAIGQNDPATPSHTALRFAKKFGTSKLHNFVHAEVNCFAKMWGRQLITPDMKLVVLRLNSHGDLQMSKPCRNCSKVIEGLGIKRVYWSTREGTIISNDTNFPAFCWPKAS